MAHFYPEEINISDIDNEKSNYSQYTISILQQVDAPIFFENKYFNNMDEYSIILQYAALFDFLSLPYKLNSYSKAGYYYINGSTYKANYLYSIYEKPNFNEGIIPDKDILNYVTENNRVNQKINEHFNIIMHSRNPVQIAYIVEDGDNFKIIYKIPKFEEIIRRAGPRPILFVSILGRYQQGKTFVNSGITGNLGYEVGNGNKETTKGVYIDGPYDINYLYERFNVTIRKDIYFEENDILSPLVFFFDIEGYEGNMHGDDIEKNNKAFVEMCTPFLCLSSIYILLSEPNANVHEIRNLFDRVKVSKLTAHSKNDYDSVLQLHIVFNKYNKIVNDFKKNDQRNLKLSILEFQEKQLNEWIGARPLNKYGIKYNFYPILEGLQHFYENGMFYDVFQYFAESIIRSIENAAEGKFIRSANQSIDLFHYTVEHFNDKNFGDMVKLLIKSEHENSFETFAYQAFQVAKNKMTHIIEKEFAQYHKKYIFKINIDEISQKYIKIGNELIMKNLKAVQDYTTVSYNIEKLKTFIQNEVYENYIKLNEYKYRLTNEFNDKIDKKADSLTSELLQSIYSELTLNNNFEFNKNIINGCIQEKINSLKNNLISYKIKENLILIDDQKINAIIIEKQNYLEKNVDNYIYKEKIVANQAREENDMILIINKLYVKKIKDEYCFIEKQLISNLQGNLKKIEFYAKHFNQIFQVCKQLQKSIIDYLLGRKNMIIDNICYNLSSTKENTIIIERLKQNNRLAFDDVILQSLIDENKNELFTKVNVAFNIARTDLTVTYYENRTVELNYHQEKIETKKIIKYPDGTCDEGEWELVRIQTKPIEDIFNSVLDQIHQIKKVFF